MASSNSMTGVHYSLIGFVMLSLILGVMTFLGYRDLGEARTKREAAANEAKKSESTRRELDEQVQALKAKMGYANVQEVGVGRTGDPNTVIGSADRDIRANAGTGGPNDLKAALATQRQQIDSTQQQIQNTQAELNREKTEREQVRTTAQGEVATHEKKRQDSETDLRSVQQKQEEIVKQKNDLLKVVQDENVKIKIEIEQMREAHATEIKNKNQDIANLNSAIDRMRKELLSAQRVSFDHPTGLIRWVDHANRLVWIDLGSADKLPVRQTFSVYTQGHHGVARGQEDIKGSVEVTRIIGPHLSEARITKDDIGRPISPGDPIFNPVWTPGRKEKFSFVGIIDVDDDGRSDPDVVADLVANSGAAIDNYADESGKRTGTGISVHTKFLVVGQLPDPTKVPPTEKDAVVKLLKHYSDLQKEARIQGTREVSLNDFLSYIGYKPSRRFYAPGMKTPFKLKAGAASTGVNESIGNRQSAGQTSGLYDPSKRMKPPSDIGGRSSKLFRGTVGGSTSGGSSGGGKGPGGTTAPVGPKGSTSGTPSNK